MTGDQADFVRRLRAALPARWFPDESPVLDAVLNGLAASGAWLYALAQYAKRQARIASAQGIWLDIISTDFFAPGRMTRQLNETDAAFSARIRKEILRERATRHGVSQAVTDLTGITPRIFEPRNPSDTGGYNVGGVGYGVGGGYGDLQLPFQYFVVAFRPAGGGVANVAGYSNLRIGVTSSPGGYGAGGFEYASPSMIAGAVTDQQIYDTIAATTPAATIAWTQGLAAGNAGVGAIVSPAHALSRQASSGRLSVSVVAASTLAALVGRGAALARGYLNLPGIVLVGGKGAARGRLGGIALTLAATSGRAAAHGGLDKYGTTTVFAHGGAKARGALAAPTITQVLALAGRSGAKASGYGFISGAGAQAPSAPTGLTTSNESASSVTLNWTPD